MSYIEIFVVQADGNVVSYRDVRNNHCYAPLVWQVLARKYDLVSKDGYFSLSDPGVKRLWDGMGQGNMTEDEDLLLGSTFDRVWIRRDGIPRLVAALRKFHEEHVIPNNWAHTIKGCADAIEEMLVEFPDLIGVAFNQCSANSPFWRYPDYPTDGTEWEGECRPYNVLTDKGNPRHDNQEGWELMADLQRCYDKLAKPSEELR